MRDPAAYEVQVFSDARPEVPGYPGDARARARARLLQAAQADQARRRVGHGTTRTAAARWRVGRIRRPMLAGTLMAAAAAGLAAAVTMSVLSGSPAPRPPGSRTSGGPVPAVAVLEQTAVTAARQPPALVPGPGQYLYVRDIEFKGAEGAGATRWARECSTLVGQEWMARDGAGRQVGSYTSGRCHGFEQTWLKGPISAYPLAWPRNLLGWEGLPARPAALERAIVRRFEHGHALSSATFAYAAGFLQEDAPPAIRAALYRVIEGLPGIRYLGPVTDRLGRHGIGVGLTRGGARQELFFDPATSRALEEEIVAVAPKQDDNNYQPAGTVLLYTVFVTSGVVNSDTAAPPAASGSPSGSS
jgi:hypothetical protein